MLLWTAVLLASLAVTVRAAGAAVRFSDAIGLHVGRFLEAWDEIVATTGVALCGAFLLQVPGLG